MKKSVYLFSRFIALTSVILAFVSCVNLESEEASKKSTITVQVEEVPNYEASDETRTEYFDKTIYWSENDLIAFGQFATVNDKKKVNNVYSKSLRRQKYFSTAISLFDNPDEGTDSYYFSVYPSASYTSVNYSAIGSILALISTPSTQYPTATSFDPKADLLISNYVENLSKDSDGKYVVQFSYYRQVALGKMKLTGLPQNVKINSINITAENDGEAVTLAGQKWYNFSTIKVYSTYSRSTSLTLDYSTLDIKDTGEGMTAHFCCYPFELGEGDCLQVVVTAENGKTYTKRVTLSSDQTLSFVKDRATKFSINMANAIETDSWLSVYENNNGSSAKTTNRVYFSMKYANYESGPSVSSGKFIAVTEADFANIDDISSYVYANGSSMSANSLKSINDSGTSYISNSGGSTLTGDTWCVVMCRLVLNDNSVGIAITRIKTDWFNFTAATRTKGGITYTYYGKDLASNTRNCRVIKTDDLPEGHTFESYYNDVLSPGGIPSKTLSAINDDEGKTGASYYTTSYYTGKTTTATMTPGDSYTVMVNAVNTRGETTFRYVTVTAGGTTTTESSVPASTTDPVVSLGTAVNDGVNF